MTMTYNEEPKNPLDGDTFITHRSVQSVFSQNGFEIVMS